MQVCKWGNSLAVRLPASLVAALDLHEGDDVDLVATGRALEVIKKESRAAVIESLQKFNGLLPLDYKFDRDEANER